MNFPGSSDGKESACNTRDLSLIPRSGRSPGEENGDPLQYSCLGNPMDRGAWQPTVHGVARVIHDLVTKTPPPQVMAAGLLANPNRYKDWKERNKMILLHTQDNFLCRPKRLYHPVLGKKMQV